MAHRSVKRPLFLLIPIFCFVLFVSCGERQQPQKKAVDYPVSIKNITLYRRPEVIVSLSDEISETLLTLGFTNAIAAVNEDSELDAVAELPTAGTAAFPDVKAILPLNPDILITTYPLATADMESLSKERIKVLVLSEEDKIPELLTYLCGNIEAERFLENPSSLTKDTSDIVKDTSQ